MMTRARRIFAACLAAVLIAAGLRAVASAQSSENTGIIQITVKSADSSSPLSNARVFLLGPSVASALTTRSGIVKYTDVASGIYRVRVNKPGYRNSTSAAFELLGNKEVDVDVMLGSVQTAQSGSAASGADNGMTIIGKVSARVTVSTHDVDEDSPIRRISDSLIDALNTVAGVDVTQSSNDPDSPQTISLHGHDESQTAVTLDGIPLSAPGSAANLRGINTDLFTGASASFGARAGALGGGVNFTTLQPTQTWQYRLNAADGSFDKYNWSAGVTGSIGKLGIAAMTTKRGGNNPLTFQDYLDQSGLVYPHGGESTNAGDMLKLRYGLTDNTTLILTALENNQAIASLCTQDTGILPCGIGPNNTSTSKYQFVYGTVQSLVGQVAVQATGYVSSQNGLSNEINRFIDECVGAPVPCPMAEPFATDTDSLTRGVASQATISKDNHTITLNATTFASQTQFSPLVESGTSDLVTSSINGVSASTYALQDSIKVSNRVTVGPTLSLASTTGAGTSILAGFSGDWRPNDNDDVTLSASLGSSQPAPQVVRSFSDPQSARVNCPGGTAQISGPGDQATAQSAIDYELGWTHQWKYGYLTTDLYRQSQAGQLVTASIPATAGGVPPLIQTAVQQYYTAVCPGAVGPSIYVSEPVNGTDRLYQGYDISARLALGKDVTAVPSYSTNESEYTTADPLFTGLGSTLVLNSQIYGRPIHKGNFTIDAFNPPSNLEFIANAQYVGVNNSQHLAPYVNISFGITHPLGIGMLTVFESNAFNTETGLFSTIAGAQPQPLVGGSFLVVAANPLPPRTFQVSYSINTGARNGAGYARGVRGGGSLRQAAQTAQAAASPAPNGPRGAFAFGELHFKAPPDGTSPLAVDTTRTECTADLQPLAATALAQLGAAAAAYVAGTSPLPAVTGVNVTTHGDPKGAWYFGLGPEIPRDLFGRPGGAPGAGAGGGPRPPRPPGGPGGPGGAPPVFQSQITVAPNANTAPRPQFTPSPALIAALQPFRALISCSYATVLTPDGAKTRGFDIPPPGQPGVRPSPAPSPSPGASPAPRGPRGPGAGFVQYAPSPGLFVVRAPDLGTGGGSVKQP
ncbi:MAG: TonB-dependent receptor [Candidatus Lustribacter sp.]|jgi:hypothetical protein